MTDIVDITSSYIKIGNFDSRRRYVRRDLSSSSDAFFVPHGRTLDASVNSGTLSTAVWRYSVNGYVVQGETSSSLSFNATVTRAKL